jgi:hypothetical protein
VIVPHPETHPPSLAEAIQEGVEATVVSQGPVVSKPALLSDNGGGCVCRAMADFLRMHGLRPLRAAAHHLQTIGKIERLHQTLKDEVTLVVEVSPGQLQTAIARFVECHNRERYHEALDNVPIRALSVGQLLLARPEPLSFRAVQPEPAAAGASAETLDGSDSGGVPNDLGAGRLLRRASRYVLALLALAGCVITWRKRSSAAHWYALFTALMLLVVTYRPVRYWYPLLPFLAWFLVSALGSAGAVIAGRRGRRGAAWVGAAVVGTACALSLAFAVLAGCQALDVRLRTVGLPLWAPERYEFVGPDVANYVRASLWIRDHAPPDVVVLCRKPANTYWIAGRRARGYPWTADPDQFWHAISRLRQYGPVHIIQDGFGTRYDGVDLSRHNLVPTLQRYRREVEAIRVFHTPSTVVWRLRQARTSAVRPDGEAAEEWPDERGDAW